MVTLNNTTIAALLAVGLAAPASAQQVTTFNGPCDASAAVALDAAREAFAGPLELARPGATYEV